MKIKGINGPDSIEHCVSRMDTLAGIAIKYGVEIGDIKRMNGLVTDLQMFAHKKLQIPLPGKHRPSSQNPSNGVQVQDPSVGARSDVLHKFKPPKRTVSQAMSTLQGYYSLTTPMEAEACEGDTEMTVYRMKVSESPLRALAIVGNSEDSSKAAKSGGGVNNSVRRRQRADTDSSCCTPPPPLPDYLSSKDNLEYSGGTYTPKKTAKYPTPRKSKSRLDLNSANLFVTTDHGGLFSIPKSSSTTNLMDSDGSTLRLTSGWAFKADNMTLSAYPLRQKAALD